MTISIIKGTALCGLSLLLAGVGSAASAQAYHHSPMHRTYEAHRAYKAHRTYEAHKAYEARRTHEREAILRQKAKYARAVAHGHPHVAERAHQKASTIRHHIRAQKQMHTMHTMHTMSHK